MSVNSAASSGSGGPVTVTGEVEVKNDSGNPVPVSGPLTDVQLRATPVPVSGSFSSTGLTDTELRATPVPVSGTVAQGTKNAGGAAAWHAQDDYIGGECLEDQTGVGAVLTFTFASPVNLIVVHSNGTDLVSRCDPFGGTPSATKGAICGDDIPVYLPITVAVVKVFAPATVVVSVLGFRRA